MRGLRIVAVALVAMLAWSCAAKAPVTPATSGPRYPDFIYPKPPERLSDDRARKAHERAGWDSPADGTEIAL